VCKEDSRCKVDMWSENGLSGHCNVGHGIPGTGMRRLSAVRNVSPAV
jgi:hypothetical protein